MNKKLLWWFLFAALVGWFSKDGTSQPPAGNISINQTRITNGTSGQFLKVNPNGTLGQGTGSGLGTVTNVSGTAPIAVANGTTTPVVSLNNTAVTPGSYTNTNLTVDAKGRITAAASGTAGSGDVVGPASATDNAVVVYNGTTGKLVKNSTVTVSGSAVSAATVLATPRAIYGNNFDGSAALAQIIASTFGGTGNGFTKFSGPTTSEKTFTLPNASATLAITVFAGTKALDTDAIASEACDTMTLAASGTVTTDIITFTANADITGVTGYAPETTGGLAIYTWPTTDQINIKVCNPSSSSITPGAVTLNMRVTR